MWSIVYIFSELKYPFLERIGRLMTYRKLMKGSSYETYKIQEAQRVVRLMRPFPSICKQSPIAKVDLQDRVVLCELWVENSNDASFMYYHLGRRWAFW